MRRLLALPLVVAAALIAAGASNAGREQQVLTCSGYGTLTVTVTTTNNDHSVAWGTGKVSSPRLLGIPVSFSGTATDLTTGIVLDSFFQAKGHDISDRVESSGGYRENAIFLNRYFVRDDERQEEK